MTRFLWAIVGLFLVGFGLLVCALAEIALPLFGFALMTAYWPGISGGATALRWALVLVPLMALWWLRVRVTLAHGLGAAFVGWSLLTLAWSEVPTDGLDAAWKLIGIAGAFCFGSCIRDLRGFWTGAAIGLAVCGVIAALQLAGLVKMPQAEFPAGLFVNRAFMAEAACLVFVALVASRRFVLAALTLPALLLPFARGALLGVAATAVASTWQRSRGAAVGLLLLVGLAAAASWQAHLGSADARLQVWRDSISATTVTGHSLGSFFAVYPTVQTSDAMGPRYRHAHNEPITLLFETGILGLALAIAFCASMIGPLNEHRLVLIAFGAIAMVGFPLANPATAIVGALVAGHVTRDRRELRDQIAHSRALCGDWCEGWRLRDAPDRAAIRGKSLPV